MPGCQEAEAEAAAELNEDFAGNSLENQFAELEANSEGDDALAALKAKMGLGSSASQSSSSFSYEEETVGVGASSGSGSSGGGSRWDREDF